MIAAIIFAAQAAFTDLPALMAKDPLYPIVALYDRELAALRDTQRVAGLTRIAGSVEDNAAVLRAQTDNARNNVATIVRSRANQYQSREASILRGDLADYRSESTRAAASTMQAFRVAMAQRTDRALAAREQQFRENESTLAFNLEKRDAGRRLLLAVKLLDLHLDKAKRVQLQKELDALDARVTQAVDRMRAADDGVLASYRSELEAREATDDAQMAVRVRDRSAANLAAREHLRSQPAAVPAGYNFTTDAAAVEDGFSTAANDLTARFAELARADRSSGADTAARIAALEAQRDSLYRAIVARALNAELSRSLL